MQPPVVVRKVETKADFKALFQFPWTLYKDDPNWVPPLLSIRRELLDKKKNPAWEYLEGNYYVAWRGSTPVGTIAAFINHRHNEYHKEHIACFGVFETCNDPEVAHALLDTAAAWAKAQGYDALRGPLNFTMMDECGLLVENFSRPVLLMPYNPPYYQTLIESSRLGFQKVMDIYSFHHSWEQAEGTNIIERLEKLITRIQRNQRVTLREIDRKHLKREFQLFKEIYNSAWSKNWGYTPFTDRELDALVEALGDFFDPDLACVAYVGSDPAGFLIAVPDLNQALHKAYPRPGVPELITLLRALWHWKIRRSVDWLRVPLMGVKEQYHAQGVDLAMYYFMLQAVSKNRRYRHMDSGWVLETNEPMLRSGSRLGLQAYKTHRFYEAPLR